MTQLRKRPQTKDPVHTVHETEKANEFIVRRIKEPFIAVLYNAETKTGERLQFKPGFHVVNPELLNSSIFSEEEKIRAVKKAIAWAKHNIKS